MSDIQRGYFTHDDIKQRPNKRYPTEGRHRSITIFVLRARPTFASRATLYQERLTCRGHHRPIDMEPVYHVSAYFAQEQQAYL